MHRSFNCIIKMQFFKPTKIQNNKHFGAYSLLFLARDEEIFQVMDCKDCLCALLIKW